jgi:hypothetical protein
MSPRPPDRPTRRIEELVFALEGLPDRAAATAARELVQLVLAVHGAALTRIMQAIATDATATRLAETLADDQDVHDVLLLHDLHPAKLQARVQRAVARLHPHLAVQGVAVQGLDIDGDRVRVKLALSDAGRYHGADAGSIRRQLEQALLAAAPDASQVDIEGLESTVALVPAAGITVRQRPAVPGAPVNGVPLISG